MRPGVGAFHEAGHAVCAARLSLKISYLTLSRCELALTPQDNFDAFLTVALAGGISARLAGLGDGQPGKGDFALIQQFWPRLSDNRRGEMISQAAWQHRFTQASEKATGILRGDWNLVERLAAALSHAGYLSGQEVGKFLR